MFDLFLFCVLSQIACGAFFLFLLVIFYFLLCVLTYSLHLRCYETKKNVQAVPMSVE